MRMKEEISRWSQFPATLLIFAAATTGSALASSFDRPISAALIFVIGVTVIGAITGLRGGLVAAVLASAIYNFFLSEPVLQFSAASADEYIPLVAFNVTAIVSGVLAGRLNDRARAAERAQDRLNALLSVSERLQKAVSLHDIARAMKDDGTLHLWNRFELYDSKGRFIIDGSDEPQWQETARTALTGMGDTRLFPEIQACPLRSGTDVLGVAVFERLSDQKLQPAIDMDALAALLAMAVERCALLEKKSEAEALRRSEEFKTALLSSLSHDMRTPLSAISASASSLRSFSADLDPEIRLKLLNMIENQCERLNRYTANLLDLGQLQAGIGENMLTEVDAMETIGAVLAANRTQFSTHALVKQFDCSTAMVRANAVMLEQMLYNVLDNARRYSAEGSAIAIKASRQTDQLRLEVIDQGCGIPASDLPYIFERFYRSSRTRSQEGHGLGLSIASGFAQAFGGSVHAFSPHAGGLGTQIVIQLPLIDEKQDIPLG